MGKTRDLVKKIRDTKRTFHTKTGTIKDRNSKDLPDPRIEPVSPALAGIFITAEPPGNPLYHSFRPTVY